MSVKSRPKESQSGLSLCMWNIHGMINNTRNYNKLDDSEFKMLVEGHDIIGLVETQISPDQPLALDQYYTYRMERTKSKNGRHFGGIAVFIKKHLRKDGIKIVAQTPDYIWLKLCRSFFGRVKDIYLCIVYIPPSNSEYLAKNSTDIINKVQHDMVEYSKLGQTAMMGDLNARTGTELDFVINDDDNLPVDINYIIDGA